MEWRYAPRGKFLHAIDGDGRRSVCHAVNPPDPDEWRGTGSQDEYKRAEQLPACPRCVALAGALARPSAGGAS